MKQGTRIKNQKTTNKNHSRGFTLVEVLISLAIFSIAITGVITVAVQGGVSTTAAKNRVIAKYLADEGIELARALRDTTILGEGVLPTAGSRILWQTKYANNTSDIFTKCSTVHACDIDVRNVDPSVPEGGFPIRGNIKICPTGALCPLYYNTLASHLYSGYYLNDNLLGSGGPLQPSPFSRGIVIEAIPMTTPAAYADEVKVTVTVSWNEGTNIRTLSVSENQYDWYE
ncbi:MAG: prepilin-type N-terminal cleavage/methylation domain-containing protein [Candidatus Pacebacteria bacterium]|nr:prepilin-type N-terminal cleavage/methylation domain-containing protein [Candidatus Paceibacterota bacterium]